ncbi:MULTISPECIES: hypothetical protein [Saccharothrix]|uniref:hypothetical protein n=1 Tax=Saccharothrix TaxID=2071 RepID=UPI00093FCDA6|nr:hypothetical protein [Saccharothrix sp. CB00851]OKI28607.1 hypothetical protein A6A25_30825 [Saccharothrix sp. CB00851]
MTTGGQHDHAQHAAEDHTAVIAAALRQHWPDTGPDADRQIHAAARALARHHNPSHSRARQTTTLANLLRHWWPNHAEQGLHWVDIRTAAHHIVTALTTRL